VKPPHVLTDAELLDYADQHIDYELQMLIWTAGLLRALGPIKADGLIAWCANNSVMNSFAMHARNLVDFLYSRSLGSDHPTDIVLQDYVSHLGPQSPLPPITVLLKSVKTKADKQVAHLTLDRIRYEKVGKGWDTVEIARTIAGAFKAVAPLFPETRSSQAFRDLISFPKLRIPLIDAQIQLHELGDPIGVRIALAQAAATSAI